MPMARGMKARPKWLKEWQEAQPFVPIHEGMLRWRAPVPGSVQEKSV
jgi:hypothetical protein